MSSSFSSSSAVAAAKLHYKGEPDEIEELQDGSAFKIKPRGLNIVWGQDKRYWRIPEKNDNGPVELIQVCWLEVTAAIALSKLQVGKKYRVSFEVSLKPDAFGWNETPIHLMAKIGMKGKYKWNSFNLGTASSSPSPINRTISLAESIQINSNEKGSGDKLYFGVYEVWRGRWKGGLLIKEGKVELISPEPFSPLSV